MNLIERLRTHTMCPTPEEAADALESLTAERDALNTEAERLSQHATVIRAQRDALKTERDALRAEAGDLTVQQRNSYQKGHNAGVAHHKEATKALRPAHDDTALLREALEWFDAMRVGAMSRNNAEQLADEVSAALRERLGEKV